MQGRGDSECWGELGWGGSSSELGWAPALGRWNGVPSAGAPPSPRPAPLLFQPTNQKPPSDNGSASRVNPERVQLQTHPGAGGRRSPSPATSPFPPLPCQAGPAPPAGGARPRAQGHGPPLHSCLGLRPRVFRGGGGGAGRAGAESASISGSAGLCRGHRRLGLDTVSDLRPRCVSPQALRAAARPPRPRVSGPIPRGCRRNGGGPRGPDARRLPVSSSLTSRETEASALSRCLRVWRVQVRGSQRWALPCQTQGGRGGGERHRGLPSICSGRPRGPGPGVEAGCVTVPSHWCPPLGHRCALPLASGAGRLVWTSTLTQKDREGACA